MMLRLLAVAIPLLLLSVSIGTGTSGAQEVRYFRTDPASISVTVNERETVTREFTLTNTADINITGELQGIGVICGPESPSIDVVGNERINLQPNQSVVVKLKLTGAYAGGECTKVNVHFIPDPSMHLNEYNIEVIGVEVKTRPGLGAMLGGLVPVEFCLVGIVLIVLIPIIWVIIYLRKRKRRLDQK
jgi:hypothetical protein